jgi:uncharacterized protein
MDDNYDYDWLTELVAELDLGVSAAHVHGSLVGFLCAGGPLSMRTTLDQELNQQFDANLSVESGQKHWFSVLFEEHDVPVPEATQVELDDFARATARLLSLEEMRLEPLLPDDALAIAERANALSEWCSGFLGGLGLGGFKQVKALSKDAREGLRDLERIARTEIELDDDAEGNENALMELSEFAKVTALLLFADIRTLQQAPRVTATLKAHTTVQ